MGSIRDARELSQHWDAFASYFEDAFEPTTNQLAHTLLLQLDVEDRRLLEVGGGTGGGVFLARALPSVRPAWLVTTDISPAMSRIAHERLPDEAVTADATRLPFADQSFERLLGNLNLMLVQDPDLALAEARRVLADGGRAAWSVWGRPEQSPMFTLPPHAAERAGVELPAKARSNFHLGDRDALIARIEGAGFRRVRAWYQAMPLPVHTGVDYAARVLGTPGWQQTLADLGADAAERLREQVVILADEVLAAGRPIGLEGLIAVAEVV